MTRGEDQQTRVHYKGKNEDFVVFAESQAAVQNWLQDRSIPLVQVINGYKIFITHKHGNQGQLDTASKGTLDAEFGTTDEDKIMTMILEKGNIQPHAAHGRDGVQNVSQGASVSHH